MAKSNNETHTDSSETSVKKESKIIPVFNVDKYFELHGSHVHRYTQAALKVQYRGILKSRKEWETELKPILEGKK